jgi:hypothetical protein
MEGGGPFEWQMMAAVIYPAADCLRLNDPFFVR